MLKYVSLSDLIAGEQVQLGPGDTLRLSLSFQYVVAVSTTVTLWASLGLGVGRDIESFKQISLDATLTPRTWAGDIDIVIPTSGKANGTYWLRAEIQGYGETQVTIDNAVVISGMPPGIGGIVDLLPLLMVVMMVGMLMSTMEEK